MTGKVSGKQRNMITSQMRLRSSQGSTTELVPSGLTKVILWAHLGVLEVQGLTDSMGGAKGPGVQLHPWSHIHFGASEELLGARFEAEMAGYAGMWGQQRQPQLHCQIHLVTNSSWSPVQCIQVHWL